MKDRSEKVEISKRERRTFEISKRPFSATIVYGSVCYENTINNYKYDHVNIHLLKSIIFRPFAQHISKRARLIEHQNNPVKINNF